MSNIKHVRFAADQLAWATYNGDISSKQEFIETLEHMITFHQLDISPRYYDLVNTMSTSYYYDIQSMASSRMELFSE